MDRIALGRVVLTSREHVIALEPHDKGLMGMLLRDPYELIDAKDIFADVPNIKIPDDMFELAEHIVKMKSGHFHPEKFEDHYESALKQLISQKAERRAHRAGRARSTHERYQSDGCPAAELGDRRRRPEGPARLATRRLKAAAIHQKLEHQAKQGRLTAAIKTRSLSRARPARTCLLSLLERLTQAF
jgi:DNA end-binding protein Ku